MINVNIKLDEKSLLFKKLKKVNALNAGNYISIKLNNRPSIGEVICLHNLSISKESNINLHNYLLKKLPLLLRIVDLQISVYFIDKEYLEVINLQCKQETLKN